MIDPSIQRCRDEQLRCAEYIMRGGDDIQGARRGLSDWMAEEILRTYPSADSTSEANS